MLLLLLLQMLLLSSISRHVMLPQRRHNTTTTRIIACNVVSLCASPKLWMRTVVAAACDASIAAILHM